MFWWDGSNAKGVDMIASEERGMNGAVSAQVSAGENFNGTRKSAAADFSTDTASVFVLALSSLRL